MKYVKYILIIIILVGFFSPIVQVSAAGVQCTSRAADGTFLPAGCTGAPPVTICRNPIPPYNKLSYTDQGSCKSSGGEWTSAPLTEQQAAQVKAYNDAATNSAFRPGTVYDPATGKYTSGTGTVYDPATGKDTTAPANTNTIYTLLAPLPQLCPNGSSSTDKCIVNTAGNLSTYLNPMIKIFIALCAVLSVVMIVVGGLEYMTSELIASKEEGKKRIEEALFGLIIALGAYALLFTINPDLLNSDVNMPATTPGAAVTPATVPQGTCTYPYKDGAPPLIQPNTTKIDCDKLGGDWEANP